MTLKYLIGRRDEIRLELVEDMRRLARNLNNTANRLSDCDHPVNILGEVGSIGERIDRKCHEYMILTAQINGTY